MAGTMTVLREALEQIRKEWKTSEPEFCGPGCGDGFLKFLGVQIWYRNGSFFLNQEDFVRDLLNRRGYQIDETGKGSNLPMVKETPGEEEEVDIPSLRAAQGAVGEFFWVAIKTRPDLAFCTSQLSLWTSRRPRFVVKKAEEVFRYLAATPTLGLTFGAIATSEKERNELLRYGRSIKVVESYADASFAAGENEKSHSGAVVVWGDCPVMWATQRQSTVALSTAEAELHASIEGATMIQSCTPIIAALVGTGEETLHKVLYTDSVSTCSIIQYPAGSWRTRHLRIRAAGVRSLVDRGYMVIAHLRGEYMIADLLTKLMSGQVYAKQKALWGLQMLVQGTDLKRASLAMAVMMMAASLQGVATVQGGGEASNAGFFCSEEGVCRAANTSTVMILAQGIETVINNVDIAVYLVAIITFWELARYVLRRLYKWLWGRKVVVIPRSATLYTTVGGNCMHASSDCDVLRYSQPRAKTLCKHCVKKSWVVNAEFLGEEQATGT